MKKCLLVAVGLAARIGLGAVEVGGLPAWELADTEVSTNVPFAFPPVAARHFLLSLELAGTPSNNVQVAFGRDANTNGTFVDTSVSTNSHAGSPPTSTAPKPNRAASPTATTMHFFIVSHPPFDGCEPNSNKQTLQVPYKYLTKL